RAYLGSFTAAGGHGITSPPPTARNAPDRPDSATSPRPHLTPPAPQATRTAAHPHRTTAEPTTRPPALGATSAPAGPSWPCPGGRPRSNAPSHPTAPRMPP
ncbi:hypothetical protein V2E29_23460, partial [Streptomyces diastatochromogenes]